MLFCKIPTRMNQHISEFLLHGFVPSTVAASIKPSTRAPMIISPHRLVMHASDSWNFREAAHDCITFARSRPTLLGNTFPVYSRAKHWQCLFNYMEDMYEVRAPSAHDFDSLRLLGWASMSLGVEVVGRAVPRLETRP